MGRLLILYNLAYRSSSNLSQQIWVTNEDTHAHNRKLERKPGTEVCIATILKLKQNNTHSLFPSEESSRAISTTLESQNSHYYPVGYAMSNGMAF